MKTFLFFLLICLFGSCDFKSKSEEKRAKNEQKKTIKPSKKAENNYSAFEKAVDFANCQLVSLSLKDQKDSTEFNKFTKNCACGNFSFWQSDSAKSLVKKNVALLKEIYPKTWGLAQKIDSLKTSAPKTDAKTAIKLLSEAISEPYYFLDENKLKKSTISYEKKNPTDAKIYKNWIENFVPNFYKNENLSVADSSKSQLIANEKPTQIEPKKETENDSWSFLKIVFGMILMAFLFVFRNQIVAFFKNKFGNEKPQNEAETMEISTKSSNSAKKMAELPEKQVAPKVSEQENLAEKSPFETATPMFVMPMANQVNQPEILFFPAPNLDGTFQVSWGEKVFKNGLSVYRFKIIDSLTANFWVAENDDVYGRAIVSYKSILQPVCEEMNALGLNHTKIVNDNTGGIAKLNGDIWELVQKAKIKYV